MLHLTAPNLIKSTHKSELLNKYRTICLHTHNRGNIFNVEEKGEKMT
jgi:hypothetical protein